MLSEKGYFAVLELILICRGEDGKRSFMKCSQSCKGLPLNLIRLEEIVLCLGCSQPWNSGLEGRDLLCYQSVYILVPSCKLLPHTQIHENHICFHLPLTLDEDETSQVPGVHKFGEALTLRCQP